MASWSKRRKIIYAASTIVFLVGAIGVPSFFYFYKAPTCSDEVKDGNELGVDCGGSCQRLCQDSFLPPDVAWTRFEEVAPGLYNFAAYIINPNPSAEADNVPYHMAVYDDQGGLIVDYQSTVTLPPKRNTLAFKGAVSTGKRIPAKALFEFTAPPTWYSKQDPLSALEIAAKTYNEDQSGSSLSVTIDNTSVEPIDHLSVYAILYDKDGNTLGFSKTIIDEVPARGSALAPFTWPLSHNGAVISIDILPVIE